MIFPRLQGKNRTLVQLVAVVITMGSLSFAAVPFYNWFPRTVKESYIFQHLHYRPALADYSPRPAVHWFSFADLCALGRQAGFAQFYSPMDLLSLNRGAAQPGPAKRLLAALRRNPWLRAANLTLIGGDIYMWKRR